MATVLEQLQKTFGVHPKFPIEYYDSEGHLKERVVVHDLVHLLLIDREWPTKLTEQDEYAAAIVQAALTRSTEFSRRIHTDTPRTEQTPPKFEAIKTALLDFIPDFIRKAAITHGFPLPQNNEMPDHSFLKRFHDLAITFERSFQNDFGKPFYQVSAQELVAMEFEPLKKLFMDARSQGLGSLAHEQRMQTANQQR